MRKRITLLVLVAPFLLTQLSFVSRAYDLADTIAAMQEQEAETQQTISDLEKQTAETKNAIQSLQGEKAATQANVNSLVDQSSMLQSTINGYTEQLGDLSEAISETEAQLTVVSAEIVSLNAQLQTAQAEEEARYELLKKRLQRTYESGGTGGMLEALLSAGSMQELFTRAEYLSAIVQYDFKKIEEYRALQADIEAKTAAVEAREAELDDYQAMLDEKHDALADLTDTVRGQLSSTNSSISSEKSKLVSYEQQLTELDAKMKALEAQTAAAQAALAKQIAERLELMREDTSGSYAASASELEWLAATIQAEAGGESYTGKLAVGSVIMNRVKSSAFPNTIVGVITQNLQFASYRSGKVELILSQGPNSTCIQAAQEVIAGARVGDYLFFMTKYYADYYGISEYTMIGNHAFFYRWVTKPREAENTEETDAEETSGGEEGESANEEESASEEEEDEDYAEDDGGEESDGEDDSGASDEETDF